MRLSSLWAFLTIITGVAWCQTAPQKSLAYHVIEQIPIPGEGGWDDLTVDAQARRLYQSHSTHVDILDIDQDKLVGEIPDTPGVHGIALAPELNRGFTSNGKDGTVTIFDLPTGKALAHVKSGGENPDAILYDPATQRVFVFNGRSSDVSVIEAATGKLLKKIALEGKPEFARADGKGAVYVNLEDKSLLVSLDSRALTVKTRWPLAPCVEPSALAFDSANNRLFSGCGNKIMVVVDALSGRVVANAPVGEHVDGAAFDPATRLAFVANGEGTLTVIHQDSPDTYHVVDTVTTQKGARTVALDPRTHRLFLPTAQFGATPAPTAEHPRPRPAIVPGTFTLLVASPE